MSSPSKIAPSKEAAKEAAPSKRRRRRASAEWEGRDVITVGALPGRGLYVRHLGHPEGVDGVHRPTVVMPGSAPRPPAAFDVTWLTAHLPGLQVVHVHSLPNRATPEQVNAAAAVVKSSGRPLVFTAYHLSDPTGADEKNFAARLDALIPRADAVLTLTESARKEIRRRWSVDAQVLPHPHAVDFVRMRRERSVDPAGPFVIGAHLGSLRLPGDPVAVVRALTEAVSNLPRARVEVHVHDHLLDSDATRYDPVVIREIERIVSAGGGALRVHRPLSDAQLWDHLFELDASFVPPLHGSHSIWPEACFDLGTQVLMPTGSHASTQQAGQSYTVSRDGVPNVASLRKALLAARAQGSSWRADPTARWQQRVKISESLRACYERLLDGRH